MANPIKVYPVDYTGESPDNLIRNEQHVLNGTQSQDFQIIFPKKGPFFMESMRISAYAPDGTPMELEQYRDWIETHKFQTATHSLAKPVYGSVSFANRKLKGVIFMTYQTLGGEWVIEETRLEQLLLEKILNPRTTFWESIVDLPRTFPPIVHTHDLIDMKMEKDLIASLHGVAEAIREGYNKGTPLKPTGQQAQNIALTKRDLGLNNVRNLSTLPTDVIDDSSDDYYLTPMSMKNLLAKRLEVLLAGKMNDYATKNITDRLTDEKLNKTGTAANSEKLGGFTGDEWARTITTRISDNIRFGGLSPSEYLTEIQRIVGASSGPTEVKPKSSMTVKELTPNQPSYDITFTEGVMYRMAINKVPNVMFRGFKANTYSEILIEVDSSVPSGNMLDYENSVFRFQQTFHLVADINTTRPGRKLVKVSSTDGGLTLFVQIISAANKYTR